MAESNCTITINYECPYRNTCSDNGKKCESCRHNPKRSYYEPIEPYYPYIPSCPYPYYPYVPSCPYPYYPYWTTTTSESNSDTTYYTST